MKKLTPDLKKESNLETINDDDVMHVLSNLSLDYVLYLFERFLKITDTDPELMSLSFIYIKINVFDCIRNL